MTDDQAYFDHAKRELEPKMRSSAFVITINPDEIDPKVAMETGYAILLNKPIVVVAQRGEVVNPGLRRIATKVVEFEGPLDSMANQMRLQAALADMPTRPAAAGGGPGR